MLHEFYRDEDRPENAAQMVDDSPAGEMLFAVHQSSPSFEHVQQEALTSIANNSDRRRRG